MPDYTVYVYSYADLGGAGANGFYLGNGGTAVVGGQPDTVTINDDDAVLQETNTGLFTNSPDTGTPQTVVGPLVIDGVQIAPAGSTIWSQASATVTNSTTGEIGTIYWVAHSTGSSTQFSYVSTIAMNPGDTVTLGTANYFNDMVNFGDLHAPDFTVEGTAGDDRIDTGYTGDPEGDRVDAGDAADGSDNDLIEAFGGDDTVFADAGDDTVYGGTGNDTLDGGTGDDTLSGDGGDDTVHGGSGDDTIFGGAGNDVIHGDTIVIDPADHPSAGGAATTLSVTNSAEGPIELWWINQSGTLNYYSTIQPGQTAVQPTFADHNWLLRDPEGNALQLILGGSQTLTYGGDGLDDSLFGGSGDDTIFGGTGEDSIVGEDGSDTIFGGTGGDYLDGDAGDDSIAGGDGDDVIVGDGGNDTLSGEDGADQIYASDGDNLVHGGTGDDQVYMGTGNDTIFGGAGNDILSGGAGEDRLYGGEGDDALWGDGDRDTIVLEDDHGDDHIVGGESGNDRDLIDATAMTADTTVIFTADETGTFASGTDTANFSEIEQITLGSGDDVIDASASTGGIDVETGTGDDSITGGTGDDMIDAGDGADTVAGGAGDDVIALGAGDGKADTLDFNDGDGADRVLGFEAPVANGDGTYTGRDLLDVTGLTTAAGDPVRVGDVVVSADPDGNAVLTFPGGETLTFVGLAPAAISSPFALIAMGISGGDGTVEGTAGDDLIDAAYMGDPEGDRVDANDATDGSNNDLILAGAGNDAVFAADGDDTAFGGTGNDTLFGGAGDDSLLGADGDDILDGGTGNDTLSGGIGNDFLVGAAGADTLSGDAGDDTAYGGDDSDVLFGGDGDDRLFGDAAEDELFGGTGNDTLSGGAGTDTLWGEDGDDLMFGGAEDDRISGGIGNDEAYGGTGNDTVTGDAGDDILYGDAGDDLLEGGTGRDTLFGGTGDDIAFGGAGDDRVSGEIGNDEVHGGDGIDTVYGGGGDDTVHGDAGNDLVDGRIGDDTVYGGTGDDRIFGGPETFAETATSSTGTVDFWNVALVGGETMAGYHVGNGVNANETHTHSFTENPQGVQIRLTTIDPTERVAILVDGAVLDLNQAIAQGIVTIDAGNTPYYVNAAGEVATDTSFSGPYDPFVITLVAPLATLGVQNISGTGAGNGTIYDLQPMSDIDTLHGGAGNDTIFGGLDGDTIHADEGDDLAYGGAGNDTIFGFEGNDTVYGGDGDDVINTRTSPGTGIPDRGYPGVYPGDTDPSNDLDTVFGGAGNDTILTGDDADLVYGGDGNDDIDGGFDDDTIFGDAGDDTIRGGEGQDEIFGGAGDDLIHGGMAPGDPDFFDMPDDIADLRPDNDIDTIHGGDGNDTIFGFDDDDSLYGGTGEDELHGGADDDLIEGGAGDDTLSGDQGDDTLVGGLGADTLYGGTGTDRLVVASGDAAAGGSGDDAFVFEDLGETGNVTVYGGGDGETAGAGDTLNLGTLADLSTLTITSTTTNASGNTSQDGFVTLDNGSTLFFEGIETIICFTPGTLIATPRGAREIEDLRPGDLVVTRDHGLQPIRWIGQRQVRGTGKLAPVRIRPGVLTGLERDILVSPQHRMLFQGYRAELLFGTSEVLVAATHLVDGVDATHEVCAQVTYIHILFDDHEVIYADGAATESFHPGEVGMEAIDPAAREELFGIFPELRALPRSYGSTARRCLKRHEAKLILP